MKPPARLPGTFFVVSYDRENECFTLHVDDVDTTTYRLGRFEQLGQHRAYFDSQGCLELAERAMSQALSFGAAQAWIGTGLVRTIRKDEKSKPILADMDKHDGGQITKLPRL